MWLGINFRLEGSKHTQSLFYQQLVIVAKFYQQLGIVVKFYQQLGGANPDEGLRAYTITIQGTRVTFSTNGLADYIGIPRLSDSYPNVMPRESSPSSDVNIAKDEGVIYTDELDTIANYDIRDFIFGPDVPLYDGTRSIK